MSKFSSSLHLFPEENLIPTLVAAGMRSTGESLMGSKRTPARAWKKMRTALIMTTNIVVVCAAFSAPLLRTAAAADLAGAWASDAAACTKMFSKTGSRLAFTKRSDAYGSGLIIEGNKVRGKMATCTVKVRKQDGQIVNLGAACSTDIAVETVQFMLKLVDKDRIVRLFPGMPELEASYERCSL